MDKKKTKDETKINLEWNDSFVSIKWRINIWIQLIFCNSNVAVHFIHITRVNPPYTDTHTHTHTYTQTPDIKMDKTMPDKLMYILNDHTQNHPFCRLELVVEAFGN